MITEKDLENQNTFYKYGRGDTYFGEWFQGHFDCGLQVNNNKVYFFLHNEVDGEKWFIRPVESLEDLKNLYEMIYPKKKFLMEDNEYLKKE